MTVRHDVQLSPAAQDLKIATDALLRANGGQIEAGKAIGVDHRRLQERASRTTTEWLRLNEIAELEDRTVGTDGHPHVTAALAQRQGFVLVRLPDSVPQGTDLLLDYARLSSRFGALGTEICEALGDGKLSPAECQRIKALLTEQIEIAVAMRRYATDMAAGAQS